MNAQRDPGTVPGPRQAGHDQDVRQDQQTRQDQQARQPRQPASKAERMPSEGPKRILIAGGGLVGMTLAYRLQKQLRHQIRRGEVELTVVDPQSYMTYQSFLPEAAAGSLEPRHLVVPLRRVLAKADVITGRVCGVDHDRRTVRIEPNSGRPYDLSYDQLVVAFGSVTRTLPIPGLAEAGIGFKTVEEAIWLRNRVLDRLDVAASAADDDEVRRRALSFVFVGGGYTGVEAMAELEDMARSVCRTYYKGQLDDISMRWILVEATGRILPEVGEDLGDYTVERLRKRGVEVKLETLLKSAEGGHVVLSDGTELDADTVVWTAGVKANPALADSDLPLDDKGRLRCLADLRVVGLDGVWGAGDTAAVPDLSGPEGALCGPSAQHAVRQARTLADNIVRALRGREPKEYRHKHIGSVATLGLHKGVAHVYGVKLRGWPAWFMHRSYHVSKMPTFNRKVRIILDWSLALFFRREVVALGSFHRPREAWMRTAGAVARPREPERPERERPERERPAADSTADTAASSTAAGSTAATNPAANTPGPGEAEAARSK